MNPNIKWNAVDTVLLDMDGTLLDLGFDNYFWREYLPQVYADKNSLTLSQSKKALADNYYEVEGKLDWYCIDFWSERLKLDIEKLKYNVRERIALRPGAIHFLQFLKQQQKQVFLVTNAHPKSLDLKLLSVNFHHYFHDLVSSHELGHPKEDQSFWQSLHQKYHFQLDTTLFIDDNVKILNAAQEFGIKYLFGIAQPDLGRETIDCSPFEAIDDFAHFIGINSF